MSFSNPKPVTFTFYLFNSHRTENPHLNFTACELFPIFLRPVRYIMVYYCSCALTNDLLYTDVLITGYNILSSDFYYKAPLFQP